VIPVDTPEIGHRPAGRGRKGRRGDHGRARAGRVLGGHVPGAVLILMDQLPRRTAELDRGAPVYVVCASGNPQLRHDRFPAQRPLRRLLGGRRDERAGPLGRPVTAGSPPRLRAHTSASRLPERQA
jgi:hypothetical protein